MVRGRFTRLGRVARRLAFLSLAWLRAVPPSFLLLAIGSAFLLAAVVLGLPKGHQPAVDVGQALQNGISRMSGGRLRLDYGGVAALALTMLAIMRRARLDWLAIRPGPVEVRPLEDASGTAGFLDAAADDDAERDARLKRLSVEFREFLSGARLYETTTVPGDLETERIIEVFKSTQPSGRLATLAATWSYLWPNRAFIVSATLRTRDHSLPCGVVVTVRRLPGPAVELEPQWSRTFERALRKAAFAVTAHILPMTRACRRPPWAHWRGRTLPAELMRAYQRAKHRVAERRFDEALTMYHHALLYDADNVHLRYDVGQIFERLQLTPDALLVYAELTDRLFPVRPKESRPDDPARRIVRTVDRLPVESHRDPFLIRYRYVITLSTASRLASELLTPDWEALREWMSLDQQAGTAPGSDPLPLAKRPWRATELADLRQRISRCFDSFWLGRLPADVVLGAPGLGLGQLLPDAETRGVPAALKQSPASWSALDDDDLRLLAVEQFFLAIADAECAALARDFADHGRSTRPWKRRAESRLTPVVLAVTQVYIRYRIRYFEHRLREAAEGRAQAPDAWCPDLDGMYTDLDGAGYERDSENWLEHYVVACFLSLPLLKDETEVADNVEYARAAVDALERAQRCGDDTEFVLSKRYWLLAGDPDLTGLRLYECFRSFESRVYLHPQPATRQAAKYELFHYLRRGIERGAREMEAIWLERAESHDPMPAGAEIENWFREERKAWEMCGRLGRFYRQWQVRSSALEGLRWLARSRGGISDPLPFPEILRDYSNIGIANPVVSTDRMDGMERLFAFLAGRLGTSGGLGEQDEPSAAEVGPRRVLNNTRSWIWFSEAWTRGETSSVPSDDDLREHCLKRAAAWGALRQWATTPARRDESVIEQSLASLPDPPDVAPSSRSEGPAARTPTAAAP